jgi:[acyl-carrier-protein] S-malonyltransferase
MSKTNLVFLFPGQGSQSQGMGAELTRYGEVHDAMIEASDALGIDMLALCCTADGDELRKTELTQPAILTLSVGLLRALSARSDARPDAVAGHSLGEYSALVAAGVLCFDDALRLVRARGELMASAGGADSAMLAYLGERGAEVERRCERERAAGAVAQVANYNAPTQLVLSGHTRALTAVATGIAEAALGSVVWLPVSGAFHSALMEPVVAPMRARLDAVPFASLSCPLVANVDAAVHRGTEYRREHLVQQITSPVRWLQSIQTLARELDAPLWLEVGPGNVLEKLTRKSGVGGTPASTQSCVAFERALRSLEVRTALAS